MTVLRKTYIADETTGDTAEVENGHLHVEIPPLVSTNNSTTATLGAGVSWTGTGEISNGYGIAYINVYSDVASATDGLAIEQSSDGTNWDHCDEFTIPAGSGKNFSINLYAHYFRIKYTNGASPQTAFRLQTVFKAQGKSSSHRIQDSIIEDDDAELVKSVITGESEIDQTFENVKTYRGALQVDDALVHRVGINQHIYREISGSTTLSVAVTSGDTSITVNSSAGLAIGGEILIKNGTKIEDHHFDITNIVGSIVTLNRPIDNNYNIGDDVLNIAYNKNVSGTLASPVSYKLQPLSNQRIQLTRLMITILDSTVMDDGKFGGITALTNGVVIRTYINSVYRTLTHWQSNSDMKDDMYDVAYADKAPSGQYGLSGRWTFTKAEFVVDLDGANGDYIEVLIQDDLTGLDDFNIKVQGRVFGE